MRGWDEIKAINIRVLLIPRVSRHIRMSLVNLRAVKLLVASWELRVASCELRAASCELRVVPNPNPNPNPNSQLATRSSQLATRSSQLAARNFTARKLPVPY